MLGVLDLQMDFLAVLHRAAYTGKAYLGDCRHRASLNLPRRAILAPPQAVRFADPKGEGR